MKRINELRIQLNDKELSIKKVIIITEDNYEKILYPENFKIVNDIKRETYTLFCDNMNFTNINTFTHIIEHNRENLEKCSKFVLRCKNTKLNNQNIDIILDSLYQFADKLYFIDFSYNMIDYRGLQKILSLLEICPNLIDMKIDQNYLTSEHFYKIVKTSYIPDYLKEKLKYKQF